MQIKDRDMPGETDWAIVDDPRIHRLSNGFQKGLGFAPSSMDEEETVVGTIEFEQEPEKLEEKDRVGEDTRPRK
jgi:hypothetical protein